MVASALSVQRSRSKELNPLDDDELAAKLWKPPHDAQPVVEEGRRSVLRVVAAITASLLLPGAGQLMNRSFGRAAVVFVLWCVGAVFHIRPVWVVLCFYAGIEAGITAAKPR